MNPLKTLVVGKGIIGTIYGWALSSAGVDVTHFLRSDASWRETVPIDILDERKGYEKNSESVYIPNVVFASKFSPPPPDSDSTNSFELIFVPVGSHQCQDALDSLIELFPDSTYLVSSLQWDINDIETSLADDQLIWGYSDGGGTLREDGAYWTNIGAEFKIDDIEAASPDVYSSIDDTFASADITLDPESMSLWLPIHCATTVPFWAAFSQHIHTPDPIRSFLKDKALIRTAYDATIESLTLVEKYHGGDLTRFKHQTMVTKLPFWLFSLIFRALWKWNSSMKRYTSHAAESLEECLWIYEKMIQSSDSLGLEMSSFRELGDSLRNEVELKKKEQSDSCLE